MHDFTIPLLTKVKRVRYTVAHYYLDCDSVQAKQKFV